MAKVFISHSSKNKDFVRRLAEDLKELGHQPWLDEWEIRVGDCIVSKIESGVSDSDYVVIVLSANSVASGWVEREWKTKYWEEIQEERTLVLPVLIEDCELPTLLKTKKYADFRTNYSVGLVALMGAISPTIPVKQATPDPPPFTGAQNADDVANLLTRVQSREETLSRLVAEALSLGRKLGAQSLVSFCTHELVGWRNHEGPQEEIEHRLVQVYVSWTVEINMQAWEWGGKASSTWAHIQRDSENFKPVKLIHPRPLSKIKGAVPPNPSEGLMFMRMSLKDVFPGDDTPDVMVNAYGSGYTHRNIVEAVRQRLTRELLDLLPGVKDA